MPKDNDKVSGDKPTTSTSSAAADEKTKKDS